MNFADDLRKMSVKSELDARQEQNYRYKVSEIVKNYTKEILNYCKNEALSGKRGIKGYLYLSSDNEYGVSYYASVIDIDPKVLKKKPMNSVSSRYRDPYYDVGRCAFKFSENEHELTEGMLLLKKGFFDALSVHGFRKLSIDLVTTPRYDLVTGITGYDKYKRNTNLNYHLLYFDIVW